jgi:hypothetical protein
VSIDGQLCLELNRLARANPVLRGAISVSARALTLAAAGALGIAAAMRAERRAAVNTAVASLGAGFIGFGVAALIAALTHRIPPVDGVRGLVAFVHSSVLFGSPDAHTAAVTALAAVLYRRHEKVLATAASVIALVAGVADVASGAVYPSGTLAGMAVGAGAALLITTVLSAPIARLSETLAPMHLAPLLAPIATAVPEGPAAHREPLVGSGSVRLITDRELRPATAAARTVRAPQRSARGA